MSLKCSALYFERGLWNDFRMFILQTSFTIKIYANNTPQKYSFAQKRHRTDGVFLPYHLKHLKDKIFENFD